MVVVESVQAVTRPSTLVDAVKMEEVVGSGGLGFVRMVVRFVRVTARFWAGRPVVVSRTWQVIGVREGAVVMSLLGLSVVFVAVSRRAIAEIPCSGEAA